MEDPTPIRTDLTLQAPGTFPLETIKVVAETAAEEVEEEEEEVVVVVETHLPKT